MKSEKRERTLFASGAWKAPPPQLFHPRSLAINVYGSRWALLLICNLIYGPMEWNGKSGYWRKKRAVGVGVMPLGSLGKKSAHMADGEYKRSKIKYKCDIIMLHRKLFKSM